MTKFSTKRGFFIIEARWENTHETPGESAFFEIEQIGGSLDEAKSVAQSYLNARSATRHYGHLTWVEGTCNASWCTYAHTPAITFRITG
jgi:hypothetical protein